MSNIYIDLNSPVNSEIIDLVSDPDDSNEDDLTAASDDPIASFWPNVLVKAKKTTHEDLMKKPVLPAARIKRIMKIDDMVELISNETAILFAKACEMFIEELTTRSWVHTKETSRHTLYRSDIAMAVSRYDQFDFLIDIVPREEMTRKKKEAQKLSTPDINYVFSVPPRKPEVKRHSPRQIAMKVGDENDKNKGNSVETPQNEENKGVKKRKKSGKKSQLSFDNFPFDLGTVEILQEFILSNGEIRHVPYQPPQWEPFLIPQTTDGNYQPLVFQNASPLTVQSPSCQMEVYNILEGDLEEI